VWSKSWIDTWTVSGLPYIHSSRPSPQPPAKQSRGLSHEKPAVTRRPATDIMDVIMIDIMDIIIIEIMDIIITWIMDIIMTEIVFGPQTQWKS
jgi:hypothetical protein